MDKATKKQIENITWDMTVGAGMSEVELPTGEDYAQLEYRLARASTLEDRDIFRQAWVKCIREMNQP